MSEFEGRCPKGLQDTKDKVPSEEEEAEVTLPLVVVEEAVVVAGTGSLTSIGTALSLDVIGGKGDSASTSSIALDGGSDGLTFGVVFGVVAPMSFRFVVLCCLAIAPPSRKVDMSSV